MDAIPDLSENQVIVFADWPGRSPQEVEDQVTYPLSTNLQGLAGVREVRAQSMFGFSLLTVVFGDRIDNSFARTRVLERLSFLPSLLPPDVTPQLGPDATGLGWVYQYYLKVDPARAGPATDLGSLRSLQDFFIRYQLAAVPGVAEVASLGGFVRQYQIAVESGKMRQAGVTLREVMDALASSNLNVGGKVIEENGMEFVVRGVGLVNSLDDLRQIAVKSNGDVPIYLGDLGRVSIGGDFRRGALDVDGQEVVGGIVVMRTGENAMQVIQRVKEKVAAITPSLPAGVTIEWSGQFEHQIRAQRTLAVIVPIVLLIILMLLTMVFRSALEAAHVILAVPFALSGGMILQYLLGYPFSVAVWVGYIALFGTAIQTGVVMVVYLEEALASKRRERGAAFAPADLHAAVVEGAMLRLRPKVMTVATVIASLLPIMWSTRTGAEVMKPIAAPVIGGMVSSLLHVLIVTPVIFCWLRRWAFFPRGEKNSAGNVEWAAGDST